MLRLVLLLASASALTVRSPTKPLSLADLGLASATNVDDLLLGKTSDLASVLLEQQQHTMLRTRSDPAPASPDTQPATDVVQQMSEQSQDAAAVQQTV